MARFDLTKAETSLADAIPHHPVKTLRYPCFADGCPMPGTIYTTRLEDGNVGPGTCAWHYGVLPREIPAVTQALIEWGCLSDEVNAARVAMTGKGAMDPKVLDNLYAAAWERLQPKVAASGWADRLKPGNIQYLQDGKVVDSGIREDYADWAKRLHVFLGKRVRAALGHQDQERAA